MKSFLRAIVIATVAIACSKKAPPAAAGDDGSDDGGTDDSSAVGGSGGDGGSGAAGFALSSTALPLGVFAAENTCAGANYSPALSFVGVPADAKSLAVLLVDDTNDLVHWTLWDVPATITALPAAITQAPSPPELAPAKQTKSYDGTTWGYAGPCPGGAVHTYRFIIAAEDVATLPNLDSTSARDDVRAAVLAHAIQTATLTATSNAAK